MHIYKGKYTVLAPFWSIKRKQGRNWRTILFLFLFFESLYPSFDLMAQSDPFFTFICFTFWALEGFVGSGGGKIPPSAVYLFIASERLKVQGQAAFMTSRIWREMNDIIQETVVSVEGEGGSSGNMNCPSHSHVLSQNAMQYRLWLRQQNRRQSY